MCGWGRVLAWVTYTLNITALKEENPADYIVMLRGRMKIVMDDVDSKLLKEKI